MTTHNYGPTGALSGWREFQYDGDGRRTWSTSYDAVGTVNGSSARTYADGLLSSVNVIALGEISQYRFVYEDGVSAVDPDTFFEF